MPLNVEEMTIYTVYETAELLKIHPHTVRRYIKQGKLKARKLGTGYAITAEAIKEFFREPMKQKNNEQ